MPAWPIENVFWGPCLHPRALISDMTRVCVCVYASALFSVQTIAYSPCCDAQVRSKRLTFQAARPCWPEVLPDVCRLWPARPTTSGLGPGPPPSGLTASPSDGCTRSRPSRWHTNTSPPQHHIWSLLQRRQSKWAWGGRVWTSVCEEYMHDKVEMFGVYLRVCECVYLFPVTFFVSWICLFSFAPQQIYCLPCEPSGYWLRRWEHVATASLLMWAWIGVCTKLKVTCLLQNTVQLFTVCGRSECQGGIVCWHTLALNGVEWNVFLPCRVHWPQSTCWEHRIIFMTKNIALWPFRWIDWHFKCIC